MADQHEVDLDSIIDRLLEVRGSRPGKQVQLLEAEIRYLCTKAREIFISQPILLELEAPIKVSWCSCRALSEPFCVATSGNETDRVAPPRRFAVTSMDNTTTFCDFSSTAASLREANYLFLGDYVDRGKQSLETICLLLAYKIKYPENFFILRGNHECASINRIYGFYDECKRRYNIKLWKTFTDCFNCLPIAAIIDEKIFTMHGGLSPDLNSMEQIRRVMRPTDVCCRPWPDLAPWAVCIFSNTTLLDPRLWPAVRLALVRSRQRHHRLERKRPWRLLHVWPRRGVSLPTEARHGPHLPCPSSRRGWIRVFLQASARDSVLGPQLLWRV